MGPAGDVQVVFSPEVNMAIYALKECIVPNFNEGHWQDVGLLTNGSRVINGHPRLLRSLSWGDSDYEGNVTEVLINLVHSSPDNLAKIEEYVDRKFGDSPAYISARASERRITFGPTVFDVPNVKLREDLVAVMMPFQGFSAVYATIRNACADAEFECLRADDIWEDSTFIQDIVNLISQARIVVCDFTGHNANVFYETGIAHTLGKVVVPISQSMADIPSDLQQHRTLLYLNNTEGLGKMRSELAGRLRTIVNS